MAGSEAPPFWYEPVGWRARLVAPVAWIYGAVARRNMDKSDPEKVDAPVICIGNLTVGGTGKTPTALAIANLAKAKKYTPGFVSRGYGGSHIRPHIVDAERDTFKAVGDEPLLLARVAPTCIGANRAACARMLIDQGVDFIIMDDGFQSRSLHYDFALITLDTHRGIGNGMVIPAGPLRAPLIDQMRHAGSVLMIGDGERGERVVRMAARAGKPVMQARLVPANVRAISGKKVLAYCGIGNPDKFYKTLSEFGCYLEGTVSFGDHHMFTTEDAERLLGRAEKDGMELVTTEKDFARLNHSDGPLARLREKSHVLPVELRFETAADGDQILASALEHYHMRRIS